MENQELDISEFVCFLDKGSEVKTDNFFTRGKILKLLEFYKKYRDRVGSYEIRNIKKLWEVIARDLSNEFKITIAPNKCENKFRVLERSYKKIVTNNSQTGRGRKVFEYQEVMDDIFEKKKNVYPTILLSSSSRVECRVESREDQQLSVPFPDNQISIPEVEDIQPSHSRMSEDHPAKKYKESNATPKTSLKRKRVQSPAYVKRNDILLEIKNDLKSFYQRRDAREIEKLEIEKKKLIDRENRTAILREYVDLMKKRNVDNLENE
ncbi:uncharacterized protein [Diabrotica undecimpunctata]|uniref:uncharacterized protein n=1 Tax=Diabrotica undecimpunctata TaxID=50387 RepID=UPI003B6407D1